MFRVIVCARFRCLWILWNFVEKLCNFGFFRDFWECPSIFVTIFQEDTKNWEKA